MNVRYFIKMCISNLGKLLPEMGELVNIYDLYYTIAINFDYKVSTDTINMCNTEELISLYSEQLKDKGD